MSQKKLLQCQLVGVFTVFKKVFRGEFRMYVFNLSKHFLSNFVRR